MIELVIRFGVFRVLLSVVDFRTRKGRASSPGRPPHHVQANNCAVIAVARALVNSRWMSSSTFERASKPAGADFLRPFPMVNSNSVRGTRCQKSNCTSRHTYLIIIAQESNSRE